MAVVGTASELANPPREGTDNEDGVRTYVRTFGVQTNSAHDDSRVVLNAPGVPVNGEQYITNTTSDLTARVVDRVAVQDDKSTLFWRVTVTYSNEYDLEALQAISTPLAEPPDIQHRTESFDEPLPGMPTGTSAESEFVPQTPPSSDLNGENPKNDQALVNWKGGRGITNSAGWPYNPPPTQPGTRPLIIFTRNELDYGFLKKVRFENSVNSKPWNGLNPRQAWCRTVEAEQYLWESNTGDPPIYYWRVSYTFAIKWESWDLQILDYGYYYLKWSEDGEGFPGETPTIKTFTTADGEPCMGLLDHESDRKKPGQKLGPGEPPQFQRFTTKREQDFNLLDINLSLNLQNIRTRRRLKHS